MFSYGGLDTGHVWTIGRDGDGLTQLTDGFGESGPVWSPDGARILFRSASDTPPFHIDVVDADGSNRLQLSTQLDTNTDPSWSPDGSQVTYSHLGQQDTIRLAAADGSSDVAVATITASNSEPKFTPDGQQIMFLRNVPDEGYELVRVDLDGENFEVVFEFEGRVVREFSWRP